MGSRYGSLKQMDGVGPNGEAIIDYSIYDAIRAGFGRVVFVIETVCSRKNSAKFYARALRRENSRRFRFSGTGQAARGVRGSGRPDETWGTNHAVMMASGTIREEPFAVINADDFYGEDTYRTIADYLRSVARQKNHYCIVGYEIRNTLSDFGAVSRGVCSVDHSGNLTSMVERTRIERRMGRIVYEDDRAGWWSWPRTRPCR